MPTLPASGISNEELARVRTRMAASEILARRDSMSAQASLMGQLRTRGFSYRDEAELRRRLQSVDAAQVQAAARLLTPERRNRGGGAARIKQAV